VFKIGSEQDQPHSPCCKENYKIQIFPGFNVGGDSKPEGKLKVLPQTGFGTKPQGMRNCSL